MQVSTPLKESNQQHSKSIFNSPEKDQFSPFLGSPCYQTPNKSSYNLKVEQIDIEENQGSTNDKTYLQFSDEQGYKEQEYEVDLNSNNNTFQQEETYRLNKYFENIQIIESSNNLKSSFCSQVLEQSYSQSQKSQIQNKKINKKKNQDCRFIPNRKTSKYGIALTQAHEIDENKVDTQSQKGKFYKEDSNLSVMQMYRHHILGLREQKSEAMIKKSNNILSFKTRACELMQAESQQYFGQENQAPSQQSLTEMILNNNIIQQYQVSKKAIRRIPKVPFKVLDAPQLQDDFYLNLVDWSSQNMLAVALSSCVYLWSASTNKVLKFCDLGISDSVTSVNWSPRGNQLCIGTNIGEIQIWDAVKLKKLSTLNGHTARVGSLAWSNQVLSSGSRDKTILQRDLRTDLNYTKKLIGHQQEVCGLKWSFDGQQLASGGNDNKLHIWNLHSSTPITRFNQHTAAVKALAWSPHQHGLLASGSGTADRTIRFWNTLNSEQLDYVDTGSQVCNLIFSKNMNELISTHGYSQNQIVLWKYPTMEKIVELTGHSSRVLFLAMSPDGGTIVTGAGDETLRFWNVFQNNNDQYQHQSLLVGDMMKDLR